MKHRAKLFLSGLLAAAIIVQSALPVLGQDTLAAGVDENLLFSANLENGENPFTMYDGFELAAEEGTDNHVLHATGTAFPRATAQLGANWTDYEFQFDFQINEKVEGDRTNSWDIGQFDGIGCYFRMDGSEKNAYNLFYRVNEFGEGTGQPGDPHPAGTYQFGTFINQTNYVRTQAVKGEDFPEIELKKWYTQKIVVKDYTIETYVGEKGGELTKVDALDYTDEDKRFGAGGIRLDAQGVDAYFDNISVTNLAEPMGHLSLNFEEENALDDFENITGDLANYTGTQISEVVDSGDEAYGKVWKLANNGSGLAGMAYAKYYPAMFDNFAVSFDMKSENNADPAIRLRSTVVGNSGYMITFGKETVSVTKRISDTGGDMAIRTAQLSEPRSDGWHHYKIVLADNAIGVWMDEKLIINVYDEDTSVPILSGGITFTGWGDTVYIDNLETRDADVSEVPEPDPVPFEMNREEVRLSVGDSTTISPLYENISDKKAGTTYASSDESVAVVDEYGVVTAKKAGEAVITATAKDKAQAETRVIVNQPCKTFYYVALNGSDETGDGSVTRPFATVEKARDTIRALDTLPEGGVTVYLRGGEYYIDETITFTPEDSGEAGKPIVYASYPGEEAMIHSGKKITGFTKLTDNYPAGLPEEAKGNVYVADVEKGWRFHDLYVDGERQQVARLFNSNNWDTWQTFPEMPESPLYAKDPKGMLTKFQPGHLDDLPSNGDVELYLLPVVWWNSLPVVTNIDAENNTAYLESFNPSIEPNGVGGPLFQNNGKYNLMNAPKFIDEAGEWCVDSENGKVYWWPKDTADLEKAIAPNIYELIRLQGDEEEDNWENQVEYVEFRNLTFAYADRLPENEWSDSKTDPDLTVRNAENPNAAIFMQGVENCAVIDSRVLYTGAYAIALDHYAKYNRIVRNELGNLGCGGVQLYGYGPGSGKTRNINTQNVVLANHIHDLGLAPYQHSSAITIYGASYTDGKFNLIERTPYTAIMITGADADSMNPNYTNRVGVTGFNGRAYVDTYGNLSQYGIREDELLALGEEITDQFNTGADNGRAAIPYQSSDYNIMEYNIARDYMLDMNDGGCYYAWSMGKNNEYNYNIAEKKENAKHMCWPLYMDDYASYVRLEGNRVWATQTSTLDKSQGTNVWRDNLSSSDMSKAPEGFDELQNAILGTVEKMGGYTGSTDESVNKELLKKTYDYALTLSTEGVTDSAKAIFEKALAEAKAVLEKDNATSEEVNTAWDNLLNGIWALGLTQGDKTMLEELIQKAEAMLPDEDKYVAENWPMLLEALEKAKDVMADGDAMEEDVQPAAEELLNAILAQRYKADKSILEDLIQKAEGVDESLYTRESIAVFRAALKNANLVMADETLSVDEQGAVDKAVEELENAMANLEKLSSDGDNTGDSSDNDSKPEEKPDDTNTSGNETEDSSKPADKTPATGDEFPVAVMAVALGSLLLTAAVYQLRKKRV